MAKHAVLIHGCHLRTDGWEQVAWGDSNKSLWGRIPKGVRFAANLNAELIYWGTGASERGGKKESEVTFDLAIKHGIELARLCGKDDNPDPYANTFLRWLQNVSWLDTTTQNTVEEVAACARMCVDRKVDQLTLVSSPFHIMRCHATALQVLGADPAFRGLREGLLCHASDTDPAGVSVADVVIVEPPHRGDNAKVPFHKTVRKIFPLLKDPDVAFAFDAAWGNLIEEYSAKLAA